MILGIRSTCKYITCVDHSSIPCKLCIGSPQLRHRFVFDIFRRISLWAHKWRQGILELRKNNIAIRNQGLIFQNPPLFWWDFFFFKFIFSIKLTESAPTQNLQNHPGRPFGLCAGVARVVLACRQWNHGRCLVQKTTVRTNVTVSLLVSVKFVAVFGYCKCMGSVFFFK